MTQLCQPYRQGVTCKQSAHRTSCNRPGSGLVYFRPSPCRKVSTATGSLAGVREPCITSHTICWFQTVIVELVLDWYTKALSCYPGHCCSWHNTIYYITYYTYCAQPGKFCKVECLQAVELQLNTHPVQQQPTVTISLALVMAHCRDSM